MSSTYSPSLKIELIGTGDQSGSWGTTTNSNLGTILEQAITGVVSVTMVDADYTLSYGNGTASNESRNAVLVVGGTNTASRNVIIQPVNKVYIVINNTAGGFPIVIKTASGTGITIANGNKQLVYCNGTNTYNVNPSITSSTGSMIVPTGTTANRDTIPLTGYFRFNTTTNKYEGVKQSAGTTITTLSRVGTIATILTATAHGLSTGAIVQISGATDPLYNGEYSIIVTSTTNFTYTMSGTPAVSPAAGTPSYLNIYWTPLLDVDSIKALGSTVSSITRVGTTATLTTATVHGLSTGAVVQISGASDTLYNGQFTVTVTSSVTFTYTMTGTPAANASGTLVYVNIYSASILSASNYLTWGDATTSYAAVEGVSDSSSTGHLSLAVLNAGKLTEAVRIDNLGAVRQTVNDTTVSNYIIWGDDTTAYSKIGGYRDSSTTGHLEFYTLNAGTITEAGRFDSTGNLAIGKTTATSKVDVNGTITATGFSGPGLYTNVGFQSVASAGTASFATPSTVNNITIVFQEVTTAAATPTGILVQFTYSGGPISSGYSSLSSKVLSTVPAPQYSTAGFIIYTGAGTDIISGSMVLNCILPSYYWSENHTFKSGPASASGWPVTGGGSISIPGAPLSITGVTISPIAAGGFSAGYINVFYS